jgi:hypothetical protein
LLTLGPWHFGVVLTVLLIYALVFAMLFLRLRAG